MTGLDNIVFTETEQYTRIVKEITEYGEYLSNKEEKTVGFIETSQIWNEKIFMPCCEILSENKVLERFPGRTFADLYVYFLDHKYFESEKMGRDIGYSYAIVDFINLMKGYDKGALS